jgi:hypothetical protein
MTKDHVSRLLYTLSLTPSESRNDVPNIGLSAESLIQSSLLRFTDSMCKVSHSMTSRWKAIFSSLIPSPVSSATNVLPSANIQWTISPEVVGTASKHTSFETFMGPQARPPLKLPGPSLRCRERTVCLQGIKVRLELLSQARHCVLPPECLSYTSGDLVETVSRRLS